MAHIELLIFFCFLITDSKALADPKFSEAFGKLTAVPYALHSLDV